MVIHVVKGHIQGLNRAVFISHSASSLRKCMNLNTLPSGNSRLKGALKT